MQQHHPHPLSSSRHSITPSPSPSLSGPPVLGLSTSRVVEAIPDAAVPLVASSSVGLSIQEREQETRRLLGFNQDIVAHQLDASSRRIYARDIHAYLEFAETAEQALRPATLTR